ncbi:hypothetical protein KEM48_006174 [Puccinia striiformis f. sp. tritici PST-130]|nr:hypothetical protein KEM48_006174 [Puccinia striiformis f. sp. tritici PST-130]
MDTTIGAGDQSFLGTEVPSPDAEQSSQKPEIKLKEESTGVILDVKKTNLYFDGTDVESFLKRVEKTAKIHGAATPLRRYREDAIPRLIQKTQENQGIKNHTEYKKTEEEVTKELAHAKKLKKTKDGRIIVPDLEMLKEYVEISLIIVDFEDDIQEEARPRSPRKKGVKIKDPAGQEDSKKQLRN